MSLCGYRLKLKPATRAAGATSSEAVAFPWSCSCLFCCNGLRSSSVVHPIRLRNDWWWIVRGKVRVWPRLCHHYPACSKSCRPLPCLKTMSQNWWKHWQQTLNCCCCCRKTHGLTQGLDWLSRTLSSKRWGRFLEGVRWKGLNPERIYSVRENIALGEKHTSYSYYQ